MAVAYIMPLVLSNYLANCLANYLEGLNLSAPSLQHFLSLLSWWLTKIRSGPHQGSRSEAYWWHGAI